MVTKIKLYNPSASELVADWHVLDASGKVLGRLASEAATLLMGKHRPGYVPHMLSGDFVVITNAAAVTVTGNKADQIVFKRHSQKAGKLKEIPFRRVQEKFPERIIEHAVRGMLPKNKLGERMIRRLKVYAGEEHPHVAQLTWTEHRPERDAIAAMAAEEETNKRAESRRLTAARREIAASAAAKAVDQESETTEPRSERRAAAVKTEDAPEQVAAVSTEVEAAETGLVEDEAAGKKAPAEKTVAKRASPAKASATKSTAASTTRKKPAGDTAGPAAQRSSSSRSKAPAVKSDASTSPKTSPSRKPPATRKSDSK